MVNVHQNLEKHFQATIQAFTSYTQMNVFFFPLDLIKGYSIKLCVSNKTLVNTLNLTCEYLLLLSQANIWQAFQIVRKKFCYKKYA